MMDFDLTKKSCLILLSIAKSRLVGINLVYKISVISVICVSAFLFNLQYPIYKLQFLVRV